MKLIVALALALALLRTDADGPPAKGGLRVFEGAPGDKKLVDASYGMNSVIVQPVPASSK